MQANEVQQVGARILHRLYVLPHLTVQVDRPDSVPSCQSPMFSSFPRLPSPSC